MVGVDDPLAAEGLADSETLAQPGGQAPLGVGAEGALLVEDVLEVEEVTEHGVGEVDVVEVVGVGVLGR